MRKTRVILSIFILFVLIFSFKENVLASSYCDYTFEDKGAVIIDDELYEDETENPFDKLALDIRKAFEKFFNIFKKDSNLNTGYKNNKIIGNKSTIYSINSSDNLLTDCTVTISKASQTGAELIFYGRKDGIYKTSENFYLYKIEDGEVKYISRLKDIDAGTYSFNNNFVLKINWEDIYGYLEFGEYLISKDISFENNCFATDSVVNIRFNIGSIDNVKWILISGMENSLQDSSKVILDDEIEEILDEFDLEKRQFIWDLKKKMDKKMYYDSLPYINKFFNVKNFVPRNRDELEKAKFIANIKEQQEKLKMIRKDANSIKVKEKLNIFLVRAK